MKNNIDLTGKKYGLLTVLSKSSEKNRYGVMWECLCDCGNKTVTMSRRIRDGSTKSCGCLANPHGHATKEKMTPTYNSWRSMKARCYDSSAISYKNYGGRGITVCPEWINDFARFLKDMGERPEGTQIDRLDVNGNYTPENCRWATRKQDSRNRRTTRNLTIDGVTQTSVDWSEQLNVDLKLINNRLRRGYSDKEALFGKPNKNGTLWPLKSKGERKTE